MSIDKEFKSTHLCSVYFQVVVYGYAGRVCGWMDGGVSEESKNKFKQMSRCRHFRGYLLALYLFPSPPRRRSSSPLYVFSSTNNNASKLELLLARSCQPTECMPLPHWLSVEEGQTVLVHVSES